MRLISWIKDQLLGTTDKKGFLKSFLGGSVLLFLLWYIFNDNFFGLEIYSGIEFWILAILAYLKFIFVTITYILIFAGIIELIESYILPKINIRLPKSNSRLQEYLELFFGFILIGFLGFLCILYFTTYFMTLNFFRFSDYLFDNPFL